jgi:hypothetical protein
MPLFGAVMFTVPLELRLKDEFASKKSMTLVPMTFVEPLTDTVAFRK